MEAASWAALKKESCSQDVQCFLLSLITRLREYDHRDPHGIVIIPRAEAEEIAESLRRLAARCEECGNV